MLRRVLLGIGIVGLLAGVLFLAVGRHALGLGILIQAGVLTAGVALERWHYVRSVNRTSASWQPTGERFRDPVTGKLTDVFYNPDTGERDYRDTDVPADEPG